MKAAFLSLFIFSISFLAAAQNTQIQENVKDRLRNGGLSFNTSSLGTLYGFDNSSSEVIGTSYYQERWANSFIEFFPKIIKTPKGDAKLDTVGNVPCRFNMKDNLIEILVDRQRKIVGIDMIKSIKLGDTKFVNLSSFDADKYKTGMAESVIEGKFSLYAYYIIVIKQPDFNAAMNVGSKDLKVIKTPKLIIALDNKMYAYTGKKMLLALLPNESNAIETFMKDKSYKSDQDVASLIAHLNAI